MMDSEMAVFSAAKSLDTQNQGGNVEVVLGFSYLS